MGIRVYSNYRDFKDALFEFDKFYSVKLPDFVLCEWYDDAFNNIDIMGIYKKSDFSKVPLLILRNDNQSELEAKAKALKLIVSGFITKPIYFKPLQTAVIKALSGKFQVRSSQQNN
jgi:DNA-binding response OmpR family regulator